MEQRRDDSKWSLLVGRVAIAALMAMVDTAVIAVAARDMISMEGTVLAGIAIFLLAFAALACCGMAAQADQGEQECR